MRRLLNTIYVTSEGAWLRKDGANLVVEVEGVERGRAPLHMLDGVVSFGRAGASPALLAACAEAGITLSLLAKRPLSGSGGRCAHGERTAAPRAAQIG